MSEALWCLEVALEAAREGGPGWRETVWAAVRVAAAHLDDEIRRLA